MNTGNSIETEINEGNITESTNIMESLLIQSQRKAEENNNKIKCQNNSRMKQYPYVWQTLTGENIITTRSERISKKPEKLLLIGHSDSDHDKSGWEGREM